MWSRYGHPSPGGKVDTATPETGPIELEMGYRADEFGNVLTGAFTGEKSDYRCQSVSTRHWRITQPGTSLLIEIVVSEKPPRKLGLFVLPVLQVQFQLLDTAADLEVKFFERFHKYFHKGGG